MATAASPPTAPPLAAAGDVSEVELSEAGSPDLGSRSSGSGSGGSGRSAAEYSGWVYHLGVNSIGHEYCHLRFLVIRGKSVAMYKRDPHDHPGLVGSPVPLLSSLLASVLVLLLVMAAPLLVNHALKLDRVVRVGSLTQSCGVWVRSVGG